MLVLNKFFLKKEQKASLSGLFLFHAVGSRTMNSHPGLSLMNHAHFIIYFYFGFVKFKSVVSLN